MDNFVTRVEKLNTKLGELASWLLVSMAVLTFSIVVFRYVFDLGWVWLQELVLYMHGALFLLTAPYALIKGGHVRVDLLYERFSVRKRHYVNLVGSLGLLLPTCVLIFYQSFPYVLSSWQVFESSQDAAGLPAVFLLKTLLLMFSIFLSLQAVALARKSYRGLVEGKS